MNKQKYNKIFSFCVLFSLFSHILAIVILQKYSFFFSVKKKQENIATFEKIDRNDILKIAFEQGFEEVVSEPATFVKEPKASFTYAPTPIEEFTHPTFFQPIFTQNILTPLISTTQVPNLAFEPQIIDLLEHLPHELILPSPKKVVPIALKPQKVQDLQAMNIPVTPFKTEVISELRKTTENKAPPHLNEIKINKTLITKEFKSLPKLPSLDELNTLSFSESFDADLTFLPKEDESGYIFAITLIPKYDLELPKLKQHFTFLIDKSNSIQQGRLNLTKTAVLKALDELLPEDTFNIIAFDSKIEKMSPSPLTSNNRSLTTANEFLNKIQLGSFFSSTDLYKALFLTLPGYTSDDEVHTAILLTDGDNFAKKTAEYSVLNDWTLMNDGRVSLYAIGLSTDSHLGSIDVATTFNRGKLSNAPSSKGLKRKLLKLIKTLQNPIAKNLSCTAIGDTKVKLLTKDRKLTHLYQDQPFVILGETENLEDFHLFLQGRLKNQWINIKKTISFVNAKKGTKSLKQEWALQCAYTHYESYLQDKNIQHIVEAAKVLKPYNCQVAFQ